MNYYEEPLLLFQGLMTGSGATLYTSPALPTGGNALRPPSVILTEIWIANVSTTVDYDLTLYLVVGAGSVGDSNTLWPAVSIAKKSATRMTFATVMPAGYTLRGFASTTNKLCLTISGVRRTPIIP